MIVWSMMPPSAGRAPVDSEKLQPVQENAALAVGVVAQVQIQLAILRFWLEAQPFLQPLQILLKREHRYVVRELAQANTDQ